MSKPVAGQSVRQARMRRRRHALLVAMGAAPLSCLLMALFWPHWNGVISWDGFGTRWALLALPAVVLMSIASAFASERGLAPPSRFRRAATYVVHMLIVGILGALP